MTFSATPNRLYVTDDTGNMRFDSDNRHYHIVGRLETPALSITNMPWYRYLRSVFFLSGQPVSTIEGIRADSTDNSARVSMSVEGYPNIALFPFVNITGGVSSTGGAYIFSPGTTVLDIYYTTKGYLGSHTVSPIISVGRHAGRTYINAGMRSRFSLAGGIEVPAPFTPGIYNSAGSLIHSTSLFDKTQPTYYNRMADAKTAMEKIEYNPGITVQYIIYVGAY